MHLRNNLLMIYTEFSYEGNEPSAQLFLITLSRVFIEIRVLQTNIHVRGKVEKDYMRYHWLFGHNLIF